MTILDFLSGLVTTCFQVAADSGCFQYLVVLLQLFWEVSCLFPVHLGLMLLPHDILQLDCLATTGAEGKGLREIGS